MKQAPKKIDINPRLSVRDDSGDLRRVFALIGARVEVGGNISAGVRYAASFTDGATRSELPLLDMKEMTLSELRMLAVHGCDFRVRSDALEMIEKMVERKP